MNDPWYKALVPKNWQQVAAWLTMLVLGAIAARYGIPLTPPGPPPVPVWEAKQQDWLQPPDGWVDDFQAVAEVSSRLPFKVFSDTQAGAMDDPLPDKVFLWDAAIKVTGKLPPGKDQRSVGSCVSFGTNNAVMRTMLVSIMLGANFEHKDICEEVTYAGSRVEIGKGRISGDGSVGAWAAEFVKNWGVGAREKIGQYDLSQYDEARCRAWGRTGVPDDLEPVIKEHPVKSITQVKTWTEAKRALANGYGIAICSNVGFEGNRDANGVKVARGSWAHCMCLDGYIVVDGKEYGHIENSWGLRPNEGPVGWGNPSTAGFWAASTTIAKMLGQGDSWAFSDVKGFPGRKLNWFVQRRHDPRPSNLFFEVQYATRS